MRVTRPDGRCCGDAGSTLALVPAGTLVLILLGAIAVDLSVVFSAKRDLLDAAASVANDAAGAGVDPDSIRAGLAPRLDPVAVEVVAVRSLDAQRIHGLDVGATRIETDVDAGTVTVHLEADAPHIFGRVARDGERTTRVAVDATATGHTR